MLLQSVGVEHLSTFQRLMSEFKRRISETFNFTSAEKMSWKLLSRGHIEWGASSVRHPAPHLYLAPAKSAQSAGC